MACFYFLKTRTKQHLEEKVVDLPVLPARTPMLPDHLEVLEVPTSSIRTNEPLYDDSIFGQNISVREVNCHVTFTPGLAALVHISRSTYNQMLNNDHNLSKLITPEMFDYYCGVMLWMRIIRLQIHNLHPVSPIMRRIAQDLSDTTFSVPEPIFIFLMGIGNVVTAVGQHLYPTFPELPNHAIAGRGGYYGPLNDQTLARFIDVPCLGVLSEAVCQAVSSAGPGAYVSALAPVEPHAVAANSNLPGFFPLGHRRAEAKHIAFAAGITDVAFHSDYPLVGWNTEFARSVSDVIARTTTFRISTVNIATLTEQGSTAQLINLSPQVRDDLNTPVHDMEAMPYSLIREPPAIFGGAFFTQYCLFREPNPNDQAHNVWSPLTHTAEEPIDPLWPPQRNVRRNTPSQYQANVFVGNSEKIRIYRDSLVRLMVKRTC